MQDTRESPAIELVRDLLALGAEVTLWDPIARELELGDGRVLMSIEDPTSIALDAAVVHTVHPGISYDWLATVPVVLDASYRLAGLPDRAVV